MLSRRTVFVVGAGASVPFDFPTGRKLVEQVLSILDHPSDRAFFEAYFTSEQLADFRDALFRSGKNSVDAFLEHRRDLVDIGKTAIAYALIRKENDNKLFSLDRENWLRYLYERMNCEFERFGENAVSFVVFNYDRAIEHFLNTALCNTYRKTAEESAKQLSGIPIIHLHGTLGPLPWQGQKGRAYDNSLTPETVQIAKDGIKIIHEDPTGDRDRDFQEAKGLMEKAEQVYFLGFGFDETNINRLGLAKMRGQGQRPVFATGFELTASEIARITSLSESRVRLYENVDCISLLRTIVAW